MALYNPPASGGGGGLTQEEADALYLARPEASSFPATNLTHEFRLDASGLEDSQGGRPGVFYGPLLKQNVWTPEGVRSSTDGSGVILFDESFGSAASQTIHLVMRMRALAGINYILTQSYGGAIDRGIELLTNGASPNWRIAVGDTAGGVDAITAGGVFEVMTWYCMTLRYTQGVGLDLFQNAALAVSLATARIAAAAEQTALGGAPTPVSYLTSVDTALVLRYGAAQSDAAIDATYAAIQSFVADRGIVMP